MPLPGLGSGGVAAGWSGDRRSAGGAGWRRAQAMACPGGRGVLAGREPTEAVFQEAAAAALADARPSGDNAFKIELARRVVVRALRPAAAGTPDRLPALPASVFAPSNGVSAHV